MLTVDIWQEMKNCIAGARHVRVKASALLEKALTGLFMQVMGIPAEKNLKREHPNSDLSILSNYIEIGGSYIRDGRLSVVLAAFNVLQDLIEADMDEENITVDRIQAFVVYPEVSDSNKEVILRYVIYYGD